MFSPISVEKKPRLDVLPGTTIDATNIATNSIAARSVAADFANSNKAIANKRKHQTFADGSLYSENQGKESLISKVLTKNSIKNK